LTGPYIPTNLPIKTITKNLQEHPKEAHTMSTKTREILNQALALSPVEKAKLVDFLLSSLDKPDEEIDSLWREEVEKRLEAYQSGKLTSVSLQHVLSKYQS
jgi:putative addiction module component (TIGR02574 family)